MAELFRRVAEVIVGETRVTGLRVSFNIRKDRAKTPNTCELKVWNLAKTTRGALQSKGTPVIVVAGYEGESAQIFSGDSRYVDHLTERNGDIVTVIQCGDGEKAYSATRFSESYGPGVRVVEVLTAIVRKLGINPGNALERIQQGGFRASFDQFAHGYTANGRAVDELDRILRSAGLTWSIQDGRLLVLGAAEATADEVILLSPDTGLVGSPAHGAPGKEGEPPRFKARSLLRPGLAPARRVQIEARDTRGLFVIDAVVHAGDTAGGDWFSDLELKPS